MPHLIFSPYYDGNCYAGNPEKNKCELGTKYAGPIGLLNELELRAGLSRGETTPMQRAIAYCNAIEKVKDSTPEPFYKQSFENDPLGVAQQLLRWRDALCMAGWNKDTQLPEGLSADGKKRLSDLQEIESYFTAIGMGERWRALLEESTKRNILPPDVTITLDMKMELLPPVIRKVLKSIQEKGGQINESEVVTALGDKPLSDFADKFTLYQFPEQNDAYQWAALQQPQADVYINEDNFTFNQVLKSVGKPLVSASVDGATDLSQLLKLGISLFRSPVNYTNLMSYLNIFRHPIDKELRRQMRSHLQRADGFGEDDRGKAFPQVGKEYKSLWGMWTLSKNNIVKESDITHFCNALKKWIEEYTPEAEKQISFLGMHLCSQLSCLEDQIDCLLSYIKGTKTITCDKLEKIVAIICQDSTITTDIAKLGSYNMLKDLKGLAIGGQSILWLDCVNKSRPRYEYAFLNPSDIDKLELDIPKPELEMQASDFAERLAVSRVEKIIVLTPKHKDGERMDEHLLITELKTTYPSIQIDEPSLPNTVTETVNKQEVATQEIEYHVDKDIFKNIKTLPPKTEDDTLTGEKKETEPEFVVGYKKKTQSYSSLSELINYPFDYVLDYIFNLKDKEDDSNLSTIEGNVAHHVIHQMVEECQKKTEVFLQLVKDKKGLDEKIDKAIQECGLELQIPENALELRIFKNILINKSIPVLARIIEKNELEIADSEVNYGVVSGKEFDFFGYIDFVLKKKKEGDNTDEYYIFDFKWTNYPESKKDELQQRKELQLAFYEKIMTENSMKVAMRGYYLLKQAQLLTTYSRFNNDDAVVVITQTLTNDIFDQAINSYTERIENLFDGIIEEGEDKSGTEFTDKTFIKKYLPNIDNYYLNNGLSKNQSSKKELKAKGKKANNFGKNAVLKGKIK